MFFRSGNKQGLFPKWFWITLLGVPVGLMIVWFLRWFFLPADQRTAAVEIEVPRSDGKRLPIKKDDFRLIKGVGPKSAAALYKSRVYSFEQLGLMDLEKLEAILKSNNLPSRGAPFWQKQAALAAAGEWKLLEKLQK